MKDTITFFQSVAGGNVDSKTGIISRVSVITEGEIRTHEMFADRTTLDQVKACAESFGSGGVKVKMDHYSGVGAIVGALRNFRITGTQLFGDLHLFENHEARAIILEMA